MDRMNSRGLHISFLFSLNVELEFSSFQRLIGVQDEDSCGKSSLLEKRKGFAQRRGA